MTLGHLGSSNYVDPEQGCFRGARYKPVPFPLWKPVHPSKMSAHGVGCVLLFVGGGQWLETKTHGSVLGQAPEVPGKSPLLTALSHAKDDRSQRGQLS